MVCVVMVVEVNEYWLWIYFDGWDDIYDDWFEVDFLDLYFVGWCEKIGYFFEIFFSKCFVLIKILVKSVFIKGDIVGIFMDEVFIMLYVVG